MKANKLFAGFIMTAAAMTGFTACSSDPLGGQEPDNTGRPSKDGDGVYMTFTMELPNGESYGRSSTVSPGQSNDGTEVGTDKENNVGTVLVVLTTTSNQFITGGTVAATQIVPIAGTTSQKVTYKFTRTELDAYYNSNTYFKPDANGNVQAHIFVFCNPPQSFVNIFDGETASVTLGNTAWADQIYTLANAASISDVASTGGEGAFLMSNVSIALRELPKTADEWDMYKTEASSFDLSGVNSAGTNHEIDNSSYNNRGAVRVQRAVARFDFKDGSPAGTAANTYTMVKAGDDAETPLINMELVNMSMVNMHKSFYYLPRVSADGKSAGATLCGAETPTNYIVGPNSNVFVENTVKAWTTSAQFGQYMFYPFFGQAIESAPGNYTYNTANWYNSKISDVLAATAQGDNYTGPDHNNTAYTPGTYKVWRYITESVVPGPEEDQVNGCTPGIVFTGRFRASEAALAINPDAEGALPTDKYMKGMADAFEGTGITGNTDTDPIIYLFNNSLYFTFDNVIVAALNSAVTMENGIPAHEVTNGEDGVTITRRTLDNSKVNRNDPLYVAVFGKGRIPADVWKLWGNGETLYQDDQDLPEGDPILDPSCSYKLYTDWNTETGKVAANFAPFRNHLVNDLLFRLYQSATVDGQPGYYCYYLYWNRHNDNNRPGSMGPMEFATVRNNVYKLAVTDIKNYGHPRIPQNDPDSPKPGTPDESDDVYLTVTCEVVPWVVRINNITF